MAPLPCIPLKKATSAKKAKLLFRVFPLVYQIHVRLATRLLAFA
ncbi:hypothetical protein DB29_00193 [Shouchella clausii]|nr:hypothetical protein DB29_00193 [Shouchella clausii]